MNFSRKPAGLGLLIYVLNFGWELGEGGGAEFYIKVKFIFQIF